MNAGLDTGPVQLCTEVVAVLDPDFGGISPPLIQMFEGARDFRLGLRVIGGA